MFIYDPCFISISHSCMAVVMPIINIKTEKYLRYLESKHENVVSESKHENVVSVTAVGSVTNILNSL